ncbi:hypothetical protein CHELA20_51111 [Hyphomicrobiales bacterium]|nr:hypothetical protein CHELA20_51111 [Hyphomicrobiales bacterium]
MRPLSGVCSVRSRFFIKRTGDAGSCGSERVDKEDALVSRQSWVGSVVDGGYRRADVAVGRQRTDRQRTSRREGPVQSDR